MKRRQFIFTVASGVALAVLPKISLASSTLKGFCAEDEYANAIDKLAPDILRILGGTWCENHALTYQNNTQWMIDISWDAVQWLNNLDAIGWQNVITHPAYSGIWLMGNEPYISDTPDDYVAWLLSLIPTIYNHDPNCRIALAGGHEGILPYIENSWLLQVWSLIPKEQRKYFDFVHCHFYSPTLNIDDLKKFMKQTDICLNQNFPTRFQAILGETNAYGMPDNDKRIPIYLQSLQAFATTFGWHSWCWWRQTPLPSFVSLEDSNRNLTEAGQAFISV